MKWKSHNTFANALRSAIDGRLLDRPETVHVRYLKGGDMKRVFGKTCAMMIVALSFGLAGAAQAAESKKGKHDQVPDACKAYAYGVEQAQLGIGCDFRGDGLVGEGGGESGQGA